MKNKYIKLIALAAFVYFTASAVAYADTPMVFASKKMTLQGVVQPVMGADTLASMLEAGIDQATAEKDANTVGAILVYIPDPAYYGYESILSDSLAILAEHPTPTLSPAIQDCLFPEDSDRKGGAEQSLVFRQKLASDGSYSLNFPVAASRGSCRYVLDTVFMDLSYGQVMEDVTIHSQNFENLMELGNPQLRTKNPDIGCQFASEDKDGLCDLGKGQYTSSYAPGIYILNFKAVTEIDYN